MRRFFITVLSLALLLVLGAIGVVQLNRLGEAPIPADAAPPAGPAAAAQVTRGEYLARAGNCMGCHTAPGGAPFAGGVGIETPFGTVYASNLTPDDNTGLGRWSLPHFQRAMRHGRAADGRLLYPAFPYTSYTHLTDADNAALYAYLRSLPAVRQPTPAHQLRFPYDSQAALAVWRAMYFRPADRATASSEPPGGDAEAAADELRRGAYLVQGLGHCAACHSARNLWGATPASGELGGGLIPMQNWYAPSLTASDEAGVADWAIDDIVRLLQTGTVARGKQVASVSGPMAQVVFNSTQHLTGPDLRAMAVYLKSLPPTPPATRPAPVADALEGSRGAALYEQHCAACHGVRGEGGRLDGGAFAYPPLAGNRAVTMTSPANLVQLVLKGGFAPATAGHPRPFGMPPFGMALNSDDVAAVLTHVRTQWGNDGAPVSALEVNQLR